MSGNAERSAGRAGSFEKSWLTEKGEIANIATAANNMALSTTSSNETTSGGEVFSQQARFHSLLAWPEAISGLSDPETWFCACINYFKKEPAFYTEFPVGNDPETVDRSPAR